MRRVFLTSVVAASLLLVLLAAYRTLQPGPEHASDAAPLAASRAPVPAARSEGIASLEPSTIPPSPESDRMPGAQVTPDGQEITVAIVRGSTDLAAADAEVWWWPRPSVLEDPEGIDGWLLRGELDERLLTARVLRADTLGRVHIPRTYGGIVVAAAHGTWWGCATFDAFPEDPCVVTLAEDEDLKVRVVDEDGIPLLGVPVVLRERGLRSVRDYRLARTQGPAGIAVLRHARRALRSLPSAAGNVSVAVRGLLDLPVERFVDRAGPFPETLELVLGATSSCVIQIVDSLDQPLAGPLHAKLQFAEPGRLDFGGEGQDLECMETRHGPALAFEHVSLRRNLRATLTRAGLNAPLEVHFASASKAGECVQMRVRLPSDLVVLRGSLVTAQGSSSARILARARLLASPPHPPGAESWSLTTDENGRFALPVPARKQVPLGLSLVIAQLAPDGSELAFARAPLPQAMQGGTYDLGSLMLSPVALAASGLVLDESGLPLAGAVVSPFQLEPQESHSRAPLWHELEHLADETDSEGRFEIRARFEQATLALVAKQKGRVGEVVPILTGSEGVRLVLGRGGSIEGRLLLDSSLAQELVVVQAVRDAPEPACNIVPTLKPSAVDREGRFAIPDLLPGDYSLNVIHAASGQLLSSVHAVKVVAAESIGDRRLEPLDLRATYRLIGLDLLDRSGKTVSQARALSRPSGDDSARWTYTQAIGGRLPILCDGRALDIAIVAPGFQRVELERIRASGPVTLRRACRLRLRLAPGLRAPDPPLHLGVRLKPIQLGRFPNVVDPSAGEFDALGEVQCKLDASGPVQVDLVATLRPSNSAAVGHANVGVSTVIQVTESEAEQVFDIRFDPADFEASARSLRGRE